MAALPFTLHLSFSLVDDGFYFPRHVKNEVEGSGQHVRLAVAAFEMSQPEKDFVRELLTRKRNLWLYRCNQRMFCGDFIIVDMSGTHPEERRTIVAELKEREDLKWDVHPGNQLRNYRTAIDELVVARVLTSASPISLVIGDSHQLAQHLLAGHHHAP